MAKNLKLKIKNSQLAEAVGLGNVKAKLPKEKLQEARSEPKTEVSAESKKSAEAKKKIPQPLAEEPRRIRAKSKSDFAPEDIKAEDQDEQLLESTGSFEEQIIEEEIAIVEEPAQEEVIVEEYIVEEPMIQKQEEMVAQEAVPSESETIVQTPAEVEKSSQVVEVIQPIAQPIPVKPVAPPRVKLGPTGRHIKDLLPPVRPKEIAPAVKEQTPGKRDPSKKESSTPPKVGVSADDKTKAKERPPVVDEDEAKKGQKVKEFKDFKPLRKSSGGQRFDARDRQGLGGDGEEEKWRKKRASKGSKFQQEETIRPSSLKVRLPITVKDLASEMKLKASQLIAKLFMQGVVVTLNDILDDEVVIQLLGQEFGCEITVDTTEEERIKITNKSIREEVLQSDAGKLVIRAPIVAFMGHVDHGKTSLIDTIRKSNRAALEAGAITQHMGAFRCKTDVGDITILDTPGHEAFSAMRARGAVVTDIVVLVVAGDEGIKQQTIEAIQHAKQANVTIVVAINKCDKPNFNAENVYRELAEQDLLPESWGGQTITVNCSAVTGQGIPQLLEMLALQAEVLELRADTTARARGTVLESELHKGMGSVATVLVQNGTLKLGDSIVFDRYWGRVKTMQNELGENLKEAGPSTPVAITGLSGLPSAGDEFISVKSEKEARDIAEVRMEGIRTSSLIKKKSLENIFQQASSKVEKKVLNLIIRADVQGSIEAIKASLMKIHSTKVSLEIISTGVGEISESDVQLASASKAVILGFHTQIESHAESIIKELGVIIRLHNIIYHAIDDIRDLMKGMLDRIEQEKDVGKVEVKAVFKASQLGMIAGCQVIEGHIQRNHRIRVEREGKIVWKGAISSLRRVKEDVREVKKGLECGILLDGFNEVLPGDILQAYEIIYLTQEL